MELKLYLRIIMRHWWVILAAFVLTLIPTFVLVNRQPWTYEASTTFVIRPRSSIAINNEEVVKAVDTLSRRVEINTTFAEVADSSLIKQRAIESLGLSSQQRKGLKVSSKVIAGTNVLEISVQGLDPGIVRDFADAVSLETINYVSGLYDVFELEPLDEAELPGSPVSPNKTLNLAVGGIFGLLLGVGLVFLLEYLKEPIKADAHFNIIDLETGLYNEPYFMLRLRQEMSRALHNGYTFSLAFITINHRNLASGASHEIPAARALPHITAALGPNMRDEDVLAHFGRSKFALLLPDMSGEPAKEWLEELRAKIGLLTPDEAGRDKGVILYSSIGITTYRANDATEDELLAQADRALKEAATVIYGKVSLFTQMEEGGNHPQHPNGNLPMEIEHSLRKIIEGRQVGH